jgi:hypothetical protein
MRAPRLRTGFNLACRRGSDTGIELEAAAVAVELGVLGAAVAALARARGGRLAGAVDAAAGGGAVVAVASADGTVTRACSPDNLS